MIQTDFEHELLSKVVERAAAVRISAHIESEQLLPSCQSAYRAHHSTETAVVAVHDFLIQSIDSGHVCVLHVVLLDLSAAFDTVDHQSLLQVLSRRFGVADVALNWCASYLINALRPCPSMTKCQVHMLSVAAYLEDPYLVHWSSLLTPKT